jgi:streptogramin lyase
VGYLYEFSPKTGKWSVLCKRPGWTDVFAYCEKDDCFYGLDSRPGGSGVLCKLGPQGAVLSRIVLGDPLTPGNISFLPGVRPTQVVPLGNYVAILTAPSRVLHQGGVDGHCIYLVEVPTGRIWLTSREPAGPAPMIAPVGQPVPAVFGELTSLAVDHTDIVWIGSHAGVFSLRNGKLSLFDAHNTAISDAAITAIYVDPNNTKWFGSAQGNLYSFDNARWQAFPALTKAGCPGNEITCIRGDQNYRVWFTARGNVLFRMNGFEIDTIDPRSSMLASNSADKTAAEAPSGDLELSSLDFDAQGKLWAAGRHSLFRFDGKSWTCFSGKQLPSADIFGLWCNPQSKEMYLATAKGLFAFKEGQYRLLAEESTSAPISVVCGTARGRSAAGCGKPGGALLGEGAHFRRYAAGTPLADESVQAVAFDKQGRVWFATFSRGLVCLDGDTWQKFAPLECR